MFFGATSFSEVPFSALPAGGIYPTGVYATGQVGNLGIVVTYNAIGVSSTGQVGNVTWAGKGYTLSGVSSQVIAGDLGKSYWSEVPTMGTPNWQPIETN